MMKIQEYDCPQENVLIDIHEGYVSIDRKKVSQVQIIIQKIAKLLHLEIYDYLPGSFFS